MLYSARDAGDFCTVCVARHTTRHGRWFKSRGRFGRYESRSLPSASAPADDKVAEEWPLDALDHMTAIARGLIEIPLRSSFRVVTQHDEQHSSRLRRIDRMGHVGRHAYDGARRRTDGGPADRQGEGAFEDQHERVERRRMFGESLPRVEGKGALREAHSGSLRLIPAHDNRINHAWDIKHFRALAGFGG